MHGCSWSLVQLQLIYSSFVGTGCQNSLGEDPGEARSQQMAAWSRGRVRRSWRQCLQQEDLLRFATSRTHLSYVPTIFLGALIGIHQCGNDHHLKDSNLVPADCLLFENPMPRLVLLWGTSLFELEFFSIADSHHSGSPLVVLARDSL